MLDPKLLRISDYSSAITEARAEDLRRRRRLRLVPFLRRDALRAVFLRRRRVVLRAPLRRRDLRALLLALFLRFTIFFLHLQNQEPLAPLRRL